MARSKVRGQIGEILDFFLMFLDDVMVVPRIAYFVQRFPQLSQGFVYNQMAAPVAAGWEARVIARKWEPERVCPEVAREAGFLERRHYLNRACDALKRMRRYYGSTFTRWRLRQQALRESRRHTGTEIPLPEPRFDVLHAQFGYAGAMALELRKLGLVQGPLITAFRGYDITAQVRKKGRSYYDDLFREGEWFLPSCRYFIDLMTDLGCPAERIRVIYSGINTDPLRDLPIRRERLDGAPVRLLSVGRLVPKKGFSIGIRALAEARKQGVELTYTIVGGGEDESRLKQLARDLGVGGHVHFPGAQPQEQIPGFLGEADIFLHPSETPDSGDQDGAANAPKEAGAAGLPVIVTAHGGLPEVVEDGVSGFVVPERAVEAMADRLATLAKDQETRYRFAEASRRHVLQTFDRGVINKQLMAFYEEVRCEAKDPS